MHQELIAPRQHPKGDGAGNHMAMLFACIEDGAQPVTTCQPVQIPRGHVIELPADLAQDKEQLQGVTSFPRKTCERCISMIKHRYAQVGQATARVQVPICEYDVLPQCLQPVFLCTRPRTVKYQFLQHGTHTPAQDSAGANVHHVSWYKQP